MEKIDRFDALLLEDAIDLLCAASLHLNALHARLRDEDDLDLTAGLLRDAIASLREVGVVGDDEDAARIDAALSAPA